MSVGRAARRVVAVALTLAGAVSTGAAWADGGASVTPVTADVGRIRVTALADPASGMAAPASVVAGAAAGVVPGGVPAGAADGTPGQVVVGGKVPDEATHLAVLERLRNVYGAANVVDRIEVGDVATPPNWAANVQKLIGPQLKQINRGQLKVDGTQIDVKGEVSNEALRQQLVSDMANALNPTYTIRNGLRVSASEQGLLDRTLANRTIEFETGSAVLTPQGSAILDQMAAVLAKMSSGTVEVIGHTDNLGSRQTNITLSQARADAVKGYLVEKGIPPERLTTTGVGPDQPIASNATSDGRARNRRIEFRAGL